MDSCYSLYDEVIALGPSASGQSIDKNTARLVLAQKLNSLPDDIFKIELEDLELLMAHAKSWYLLSRRIRVQCLCLLFGNNLLNGRQPTFECIERLKIWKLNLCSAQELMLKASMLGLDYRKLVAALGCKHVNAEGEIWHHVRGKNSRIWFKGYKPAECPKVWNGDLSFSNELVLSTLDDLSGCPRVVHGSFSCCSIGLKSLNGFPDRIGGDVDTSGNYNSAYLNRESDDEREGNDGPFMYSLIEDEEDFEQKTSAIEKLMYG